MKRRRAKEVRFHRPAPQRVAKDEHMVEAEDLRALPPVDGFLQTPAGGALAGEFGTGLVKQELRALLAGVRERIRAGEASAPDAPSIAGELRPRLARIVRADGRRALNATGILLHTGLGRAPLSSEATAALGAAGGYTVLQTSVETGKRCLREEAIERMLQTLTGCEAATVVNNNAAATMLALNTVAAGREVVVSNGQLIEIGGAFRLPDVMEMSGARLRGVGCSNRTHVRDYETAIGEETGAIIHVHTSNYRVRGFAGTPGIRELVPLGVAHGVPVLDDLGSGALTPLSEWGLADEPLVRESLKAGVDLCFFSGDKLIGGPQSGVLLGRRDLVERIRRNPFARMFRVGKLTLAALEVTLAHFVNDTFREAIPFYRMLCRPVGELQQQADRVAGALAEAGLSVAVEADTAYVGSGSLPDEGVPSRAVVIDPAPRSAETAAARLRAGLPAVFARIQGGRIRLDMRTVGPGGVDDLLGRVQDAFRSH
jgi:L-seryl-tRNA(Ser) seleniumtransferase